MALRELDFAEMQDLQKRIVKQDDDQYITRDDDLWLDTVEDLKSVRLELLKYKDLLKREEKLKDQLISLSMEKDSKGGGIKLRKMSRKGNVEVGLIPELWGIDLDTYRKPSTEYWQVSEDV